MPRCVCCVPGCSIAAADGVPLHYFPNPETFAERFQVWVKNIRGDIASLDSTTIHKTRRICRRHFERQFLYPKNRLGKLAVPTLLLPLRDISETKVNLHKFPNPAKDKELFNTWLYSIGGDVLQLENNHIFKYRRVCRVHFDEKYWCRNNRLTKEAVPTKNMPGATTSPTRKELNVCDDPVPTASKASVASLSAPGTSRATGPTIDVTQTPNSPGETIAEGLPSLKSLLLKPIIEDKVQHTTETTHELPSCSTTVENIDICDDDDNADDDSDTLVESNVCRVCLAMDVKMYDLNDIGLREMFQNITGIAVTENSHSILERLCWECAGRLKAAAAFRNKALFSDALLQGLANTGEQIRKNDITLIKDSEDYLKTAATLTVVEAFHTVDIDPENDGIPPLSENNDTKILQNTVRKDFLKLTNKSINEKDNDQTDVENESMIEAPINTEMEYDQFDHICPNAGEESSNVFLETTPLFSSNISLKEVTINSANSSPPPSSSHVKPKNPIRCYRLKTPGDCEDKIQKHVMKITKRDSISKIVFINSKELISAKSKNINVKIGGISKKTSNLKLLKYTQKANTPTDEESLSFENFEF